jgi:hypothetical protein
MHGYFQYNTLNRYIYLFYPAWFLSTLHLLLDAGADFLHYFNSFSGCIPIYRLLATFFLRDQAAHILVGYTVLSFVYPRS